MLGMHRCGASLTARVLDLLGFALGPEAEPAAAGLDDPSDVGDQGAMTEINDAVFATLGGSWSQPPELPRGWEDRPELTELRARAREVIEARFGGVRRWAWKDPRMSLTLPFWRETVPRARYVVCLRSPVETAASLLSREPTTHTWESANALWLRYSAQALENTQGESRLILFYEDYFENRAGQLARIADFVGSDLSELSEAGRRELESAVEADRRHHRTSPQDVAEGNGVPVEARAFYLAARSAHVASELRGGRGSGRFDDGGDPGLSEAIEGFLPRLWRDAGERRRGGAEDRRLDTAVAVAEEDRARARREERYARAALDRALEELEGLRAEVEAGGAGLSPAAGADGGILSLDSAGGRRDQALARAREQASDERRARIAIEQSLSWRITRPLRVSKGALAGPRHRLQALASARRRGSIR